MTEAPPAPADMWEWAAQAFEPPPNARPAWRDVARPEQLPPPGDWLTWLLLAGRGFGKTRTCAEAIAEDALRFPGYRAALVAATYQDGRDTMVEGEAGLLEVIPERELRGRSREKAWNRSLGELYLANGSRFKIFSSERPGRIRGPEHHGAWGDEIAQWLDAHLGTAKDTTWSNLLFGLRLPARPGWPSGFQPRIYASTTPRNVPLLKVRETILAREPHRAGIIQLPSTVVTRGRTADNLANLSDRYRERVVDPLVGTTLGRQELEGELFEDVEGALLARAHIERGQRIPGEVPILPLTVVTVDPAVSTGEDADETAILVVAADSAGDGWVLDDRTDPDRGEPSQWGEDAWEAVIDHGAAAVVVEDNQGGDMVEHVLMTTLEVVAARRRRLGKVTPRVPIVRVHPTSGQGKWVRAQAVQPLYEQGRIHHVNDPRLPGRLDVVEDQLCTWTGDKQEDSPDRVDALVHGLTWCLFPQQRKTKKKQPGRRASAPSRR